METICTIHDSGSEAFCCEACYNAAISQCPTCLAWWERELERETAQEEMAMSSVREIAQLSGEGVLSAEETMRRYVAAMMELEPGQRPIVFDIAEALEIPQDELLNAMLADQAPSSEAIGGWQR